MNPSPRKRVALFTDGACLGNPGPGGWAALLRFNAHEKLLSGGEACTTNNRMELKAAIEGLKALKEPCEVDLYTDSHYLKKAFTEGWLEGWRKRGGRTAEGRPVNNRAHGPPGERTGGPGGEAPGPVPGQDALPAPGPHAFPRRGIKAL